MSFRHLWPVAIVRTAIVAIVFIWGCLSCCYTQLVGIIIFKKLSNQPHHLQAIINLTKQHFVILMTFLTGLINPLKVFITWDKTTTKNHLFQVDSHGNLQSNLCHNSILISNHQIYTDWLFLWWISYTSNLSSYIYIVLKDLSKIPVLGWGMINFKFLFLTRKWENDKITLTNQLNEIDADARGRGPASGITQVASVNSTSIKWPPGTTDQVWPYQLIIFPEGTVTSDRTTKKSAQYCLDKNIPQLHHVLLPRVRGLFLALRKLRNSVESVYDFTTGYGNLKPDEYGEIKFSLKRFYILGHGPPTIHYYVREFKIADIPLGKDDSDSEDADPQELMAFESWLYKIWYEKDKKLQYFYEHGTFDDETEKSQKTVFADLKLRTYYEILTPFITLFTTILIIRLIWAFIKNLIFK